MAQWNTENICTKPEKLPHDFFSESAFGKSTAETTKEMTGAKEPARSNLNIERFRQLGFPESFCRILENGLPLLLHTIPNQRAVENHQSVAEAENQSFVQEALAKWEGAGVFAYTDDRPHLLNPLKVVVKGTKRRLVLDARSSGLNEGIWAPKFALPRMDEIIHLLRDEAWMMKADLENGFLQLPINKPEQTYLGFKHPISKRHCCLQRLPFGLASAPFLFQTFTIFLQRAMEHVIGIQTRVYIDDWFLTDSDQKTLRRKFDKFEETLKELGVALQRSKTEGPTKQMTYLGLGIDTEKRVLFLPEEKRRKYLEGLRQLLRQRTSSMEEIAITAGRLVHISAIHKGGMGHVQPLWNVMYSEKTTWTKRELTAEILTIEEDLTECLRWWELVLAEENITRKLWRKTTGNLLLWTTETAISDRESAITLCTDASDWGWGAATGIIVASGKWTERQQETSINWRELKAIIFAIQKWSFVRDSPVLVLTDNVTATAAIRTRNARAQPLQDIIQELNEIEEIRRIEAIAMHIPGALNDLPDRLSRGKETAMASILSFNPTRLPSEVIGTNHLVGLTWTGRRFGAEPFKRYGKQDQGDGTTTIAITTPDIPFLRLQLQQMAKREATVQVLIPKIPTSLLPVRELELIAEIAEGACLEAPLTEWWLFRKKK